MNLAGLRFHPLKGADRGRYAVDASGNWRITFGWDQAERELKSEIEAMPTLAAVE